MLTVRRAAMLLPLALAACDPDPKPGTQIGALREPDPSPMPPSDTRTLDMGAAVEEALRIGGITTLTAAWAGHVGSLDLGAPAGDCPQIWVGPLPDDVVDVDMDEDEPGLSWLSNCETRVADGENTFSGFTHWTTTMVEGESGARTLVADAEVTDKNGKVLFGFDGEADDSLDLATGTYTSNLDGEVVGTLSDAEGGFRTGGGFEASWSPSGTLRMFGTVTAFDGFGPPDNRTIVESPEIAGLAGWVSGMPRFTSVRFDLEFMPECTAEPVGYVGIRGNEGFWFDVYFLPIADLEAEPTAQSTAFPYEQIDNIACDGIGTLFARNIDLRSMDLEDDGWSRELSPDFAGVIASLPVPTLDDYVYTLRDLPSEE